MGSGAGHQSSGGDHETTSPEASTLARDFVDQSSARANTPAAINDDLPRFVTRDYTGSEITDTNTEICPAASPIT